MKWEEGDLKTGLTLANLRNKRGTRIDPCGTPQTISLKPELALLYETYCFLHER